MSRILREIQNRATPTKRSRLFFVPVNSRFININKKRKEEKHELAAQSNLLRPGVVI